MKMSREPVTPQAIAGNLRWRKDLHLLRSLWRGWEMEGCGVHSQEGWVVAARCDFWRIIAVVCRCSFFSPFLGKTAAAVVMPP